MTFQQVIDLVSELQRYLRGYNLWCRCMQPGGDPSIHVYIEQGGSSILAGKFSPVGDGRFDVAVTCHYTDFPYTVRENRVDLSAADDAFLRVLKKLREQELISGDIVNALNAIRSWLAEEEPRTSEQLASCA